MAAAVAFDERNYTGHWSNYGEKEGNGAYLCENERAGLVDETVYKFKIQHGEEGYYHSDFNRVRNAVCWYLWEKEIFNISKAYYYDWTDVSSTLGYTPADEFHNVTFSIWYLGDKTNPPRDKDYWSYNGVDNYPGRCIDGFQYAISNCYCKGDECGQEGVDMNWGGSWSWDGWMFKVGAYAISPSFWWNKMGNGDEELYLAPHDSPPLESGATTPNPVTSTKKL